MLYSLLYLHLESWLYLYKEVLQFSLISEFTSTIAKNEKYNFFINFSDCEHQHNHISVAT